MTLQIISLGTGPNTAGSDNAFNAFTKVNAALATLAAQSGTPIDNPSPPAVTPYSQSGNNPAGPVSTSLVLPFGVTLAKPNSNVLDWTFGSQVPGATIRTRVDLDRQAWYEDLFNEDGQAGYASKWRSYPAYLSDGVTRDPRDLHPIYEDRIDLIARTTITGDSDSAAYQAGYMRPPTQFLPGMYAEICCKWPNNRWSWPTFWMFCGTQALGDANQYYAGSSTLEIDVFDGFSLDNTSPGLTIPTGIPLGNAGAAGHGYPKNLYVSGAPPWTAGSATDPVLVTFDVSPEHNPTLGYHYYAVDWRDFNTILWIYDGIVIRKTRVDYNITYDAGGYSISPPPSNLVGTILPMFVQIDHQLGPTFNPIDTAALLSNTDPIRAAYSVKSVRIWNSPSTADVPTTTAQPLFIPTIPQTTAIGNLPALSTGAYVLNVDAGSYSPTSDLVGGNAVVLVGDAAPSTSTKVNSLNTITTTNGGLSITGPALAAAQGAGQIVLFVAVANLTLSFAHAQIVAQLVRASPQSNTDTLKMTLAMSGLYAGGIPADAAWAASSFAAFLQDADSGYVVAGEGAQSGSAVVLLSVVKSTVSDGTVVVGQGTGNARMSPATSGGIASTAVAGWTELTVGFGRDEYGVVTRNVGCTLCQVVGVAVPTGGTLSDADFLAVSSYLGTRWAISNGSLSTTANAGTVAGFVTGSSAGTLGSTSFDWFNQDSASVSGGGASDLAITAPAAAAENMRCILTALSGIAGSVTARLAFTSWNSQYYRAGLVLVKENANSIAAFALEATLPSSNNDISVYLWTAPTIRTNNAIAWDQYAPIQGDSPNPYFRIVFDGTSYTFFVSTNGAVGNWHQVGGASTAATLRNPTHVGIGLSTFDAFSQGHTANISLSYWNTTSSTNGQASI